MSDTDYIPADHEGRRLGLGAPSGTWQHALCASHAVADSVMDELAAALRAVDYDDMHTDFCGSDACLGCNLEGLALAALRRYDALKEQTDE